MLNWITQIRSASSEQRLCARRCRDAAFPIKVTRQLADLFTTAVETHGLAALPRLARRLLSPEVMHDLIDWRRSRLLNLGRRDQLEVSVRARSKVTLQET